MAEVQDFVIKIRTDKTDAETGIKSLGSSFAGLSSAINPLTVSLGLVTAGVLALGKVIDRGQVVSELTAAFNTLEKQAGGSVLALDQLKNATGGLINNLDLMRASNQALLSGLTPDQFLSVASAADTLGDAVGKNTKEALDDLTSAVSTGNERLLKAYGITIDNVKAQENYAKSLGITVKQLNESEIKEANRIALLDAIEKKTRSLGSANETAGDQVQKLGVSISDSVSYITQWVNESTGMISALKLIIDLASNATSILRLMFSKDTLAEGARIIDEQAKSTERLALAQSQLANSGFNAGARQIAIKAIADEEAHQKALGEELVKLKDKYKLESEEQAKGTKGTIDHTRATGELTAALKAQSDAYSQIETSRNLSSALSPLEASIKSLNVSDFNIALANYRTALEQSTRLALEKEFPNALASGGIGAAKFEAELAARVNDGLKDFPTQLQAGLDESFQKSVDFFADILTTSITGSAQDIQEILTDALKRVAIGFGSQVLATLSGGFGSDVTSAQGLGQSLAKSLLGQVTSGAGGASSGLSGGISGLLATSGIGSLSSLFGLGGAVQGPVAAGGTAPIAAGSSSLLAQGQAVGGAIGAALVGYLSIKGVQSAASGGKLSFGEQAALALPTFGTSFLYNPISSFFGGDSQLAAEREAREKALSGLQNQSFQGVKGTTTLNAKNFNLDQSGLGGQAAGLASPLASILSGGSGKLKNDLTAIFANATKDADNFNEVLINTQSLMGSLGVDAEDAKNQLTSLFLDGKVSLDEFNTGIENLDILTQNNLRGKGSVTDAIKILSSELSNPRTKIQAIALAFVEMAELGITSASDIHAYITEKFGPDIAASFDEIKAAGLDTFDEIASDAPGSIKIIANAFHLGLGQINSDIANTGDTLSSEIETGAKKAAGSIRGLSKIAREEGAKIESALKIKVSIQQTTDNNTGLNGNPP